MKLILFCSFCKFDFMNIKNIFTFFEDYSKNFCVNRVSIHCKTCGSFHGAKWKWTISLIVKAINSMQINKC